MKHIECPRILAGAICRLRLILFAGECATAVLASGAPPIAMRHVILHRDNTMFYLGPSLAQLPDGEILMSVREAHARLPERQSHLDPSSRGIMLRSRDGGRTFGEKQIIYDETYRFSAAEDTVLTALADGSLLASIYTWGIAPVPTGFAMEKLHSGRNLLQQSVYGGAEINFGYVGVFEGLWTESSSDGGRSWTPRRPVDIPGLPPLVGRAPAVELRDGTLLMIVQDFSMEGYHRIYCIRSTDKGATWGHPVLAADASADRLQLWEASLVRLRGGRLIVMSRTDHSLSPDAGRVVESVSDDGGESWSKPRVTPMWGFPASVLELKDGRLLCAYGHRRPPYGIRATLSHDHGDSWDFAHEIIIRNDGGSADLGYPVSIQLPDGEVLMAYYFNQEKAGDPASRTRYIAGTFLKL